MGARGGAGIAGVEVTGAGTKLGARKHLLLTKKDRASLPALYATEGAPLDQKMLKVKFFSPYSGWRWYAAEFDGADTFFGYVEGFEKEWGYFSLSELESSYRGSLPLVERDRWFSPCTVDQAS